MSSQAVAKAAGGVVSIAKVSPNSMSLSQWLISLWEGLDGWMDRWRVLLGFQNDRGKEWAKKVSCADPVDHLNL